MITSDKLRKDVGCWACIHSETSENGGEVVVSCKKQEPEFQRHGWETALTCKEFRMKTINRLFNK